MPTHKTNSIVYDDRETASKFNMSLETRIMSYKQIQNKVHDSFLKNVYSIKQLLIVEKSASRRRFVCEKNVFR